MHQRTTPRLLGTALALAVVVAACGGSGNGRLGERGAAATPQPTSFPVADASPQVTDAGRVPGSDAPATGIAAATPHPTATQTISTAEAADLLRQVDDLLRQANADLAADGDAAITMGE